MMNNEQMILTLIINIVRAVNTGQPVLKLWHIGKRLNTEREFRYTVNDPSNQQSDRHGSDLNIKVCRINHVLNLEIKHRVKYASGKP